MGYTYTPNAGLRVPDEAAADDVPADLSYILTQLDTAVVLYAVSLSDRDSKYYNAPSGVICVVRAVDTTITGIYVKRTDVGTATWGTVWEPPSALTFVAISPADQYTSRGTPTYDPGVWGEPGGVFATCKGAIVKVDATNISNGSVIGNLPSGYLPLNTSADYPCATTYQTANIGSSKINLTADGTITYFGPTLAWVSLDGLRYFRAQS